MEDPKIFWCLVRDSIDNLAMRQVWDGGDIVANIRPDNGVKQVKIPLSSKRFAVLLQLLACHNLVAVISLY